MEELCTQIEQCELDKALLKLEWTLKCLECELLKLQKEIQFGGLPPEALEICKKRRKLLRREYRASLRLFEKSGQSYDVPEGILPENEDED